MPLALWALTLSAFAIGTTEFVIVGLIPTIAALGLVPLLLATGPGSEIQKPLAIVVIGGLISATLLTLILLPILFRRFGVAGSNTTDTEIKP